MAYDAMNPLSNSFIKKYKAEAEEMLQLVFPQLTPNELDYIVDQSVLRNVKDINVVVDNNLNTISSESNNPTVENAIPSNINQTIVPEIPNIDNVQNMDNTINSGANEVNDLNNNGEVNLTINNQNVNVIPSFEEVGSNLVSEKPPVNIEINNIPINSVEQNNNELPSNQVINEPVVSEINVMNNPINNEEQNVIPEIQSIPNIPVEDNSKKNITDTMSLNELLAEINIEEQK